MRIFPLSESALTIELGNEISTDLNSRAIALAQYFSSNPFPGLIEAAPAYASVTFFYDLAKVRRSFPRHPSTFEAVNEIVKAALESAIPKVRFASRLVEIRMVISETDAPDLSSLAERAGLSTEEVIDIFTSRTYRVYMIGFLPGFAYMGEVDERIATPRLSTPRTSVPEGSIGIAGKQTGIYPLASPGGWNVIGRTEMRLFDPASKRPTLLQPGDEVRFIRR